MEWNPPDLMAFPLIGASGPLERIEGASSSKLACHGVAQDLMAFPRIGASGHAEHSVDGHACSCQLEGGLMQAQCSVA